MSTALPLRSEVPVDLTWDSSLIFPTVEDFQKSLTEVQDLVERFVSTYENQLNTESETEFLVQSLRDMEALLAKIEPLGTYCYMACDTDRSDEKAVERMLQLEQVMAQVGSKLAFYDSQLLDLPAEKLESIAQLEPTYANKVADLKQAIAHRLSGAEEALLASLSPVLNFPGNAYSTTKFADMHFDGFEVDGKSYANSFVLYENNYCTDAKTQVRREAFRTFSEGLERYQNTIGANYFVQVQQEKLMSQLRRYPSVFDYLLDSQKVDRRLFDRQIDLIMRDLAPAMRRFAKLLQRAHGLDELHYADLKLTLDPSYDPEIDVPEAKRLAREALSVLGDEYLEIVDEMQEQRRIDFAQNQGKSTGGYCASPYGAGSFILLNWNGKLDEVFTLVHELGHAGHFQLSQRNHSPMNTEPSLYVIEAPSTCNELLFAQYLMKQKSDDKRFRRWVLAAMITNTYYHNFITHLLEAAYQRQVYEAVDRGEVLQAGDFSRLYREQLELFWGDSIIYDKGCELTWMRQPHYYNGLYPYTYSAGLTIATAASLRMQNEGQVAIDDWLRTLKAGSTLKPLDFAKSAGVDISTDKALSDTIAFISGLVDEIEALTAEIGDF